MSYLKEFPDFGVMDVKIPEGFNDVSWHNDAMPRFTNESILVELWVDFADRDLSDLPSSERFGLSLYAEAQKGDMYSADPIECYGSDNYQDILDKLAEWKAKKAEQARTYNHAYTIAFEVRNSTNKEGEDVTAISVRHALTIKLLAMSDDELMEAIGAPFDTFKEEPEHG